MKLGLFMMPLHDPDAALAPKLYEDRECIILLDQLGYDEVWVGEHYTALSESPFPTRLPQHHPLQYAASAAQFDILSEGRFNMGIGPAAWARIWRCSAP